MKKLIAILCLLFAAYVYADGIGDDGVTGEGVSDDGVGGYGIEDPFSTCAGGYTALTGSDSIAITDSTGGSICCPD